MFRHFPILGNESSPPSVSPPCKIMFQVLRFTEHTAAVKAIAWSPHQHGILASGGGTADRCIRFWNSQTSARLSCVDTGSQVMTLLFSLDFPFFFFSLSSLFLVSLHVSLFVSFFILFFFSFSYNILHTNTYVCIRHTRRAGQQKTRRWIYTNMCLKYV